MISENKLTLNENDTCIISEEVFDSILRDVRNEYGHGFTKILRDADEEKYVENIKEFMKSYYMIRIHDSSVELMPLIGKITGMYPEDYKGVEN